MSRIQSVAVGVAAALGVSVLAAVASVPAAALPAVSEEANCLDLTPAQLDAASVPNGTVPVPCSGRHNFEAVRVFDVPDRYARYGRLSMPVKAWVNNKCVVAVRKFAGLAIPTYDWRPYAFLDNRGDWNAGSHLALCGGVRYDWTFDEILTTYGSIQYVTEVAVSCARLRHGHWSLMKCREGKGYYWAKEVPLGWRGITTKSWPGRRAIMAKGAKQARKYTRIDQPGDQYAWWVETGRKWWNRGFNRWVYLYLPT